jgi:MFS family permease
VHPASWGLGTALTYPTLLAAVSDHAGDMWRASAIGVFRLWRDLGYVFAGAVMSLAALHGGPGPFLAASALCLLSAVVVAALLPDGGK